MSEKPVKPGPDYQIMNGPLAGVEIAGVYYMLWFFGLRLINTRQMIA